MYRGIIVVDSGVNHIANFGAGWTDKCEKVHQNTSLSHPFPRSLPQREGRHPLLHRLPSPFGARPLAPPYKILDMPLSCQIELGRLVSGRYLDSQNLDSQNLDSQNLHSQNLDSYNWDCNRQPNLKLVTSQPYSNTPNCSSSNWTTDACIQHET